ncbi:MAG TPA: hypothetical protein VFO60_05520, partial [Candidatus Dormibacteraeota bacterium]|nr:hypothetical protein [Candidatus Dormibacteraeota bacterium]
MRRAGAVRRRRAGLVTASLCAALLVACGGEAGSSTATASATSAQSTSSVSVARTANGVYGGRYCELFLLDIDSTPIRAAVWNTYPFDDCPAAGWNAIDTGAVARDHGVAYSFKNGPRYWAVDDIEQIGPASPPIADFGGVRMQLEATLILGNLDTSPYIEHRVERHTVF